MSQGHFAEPAAEGCGPPGDPLRIECDGTLVLTEVVAVESAGTSAAITGGSFASVTVNGLAVRSEPTTTAPALACLGAPDLEDFFPDQDPVVLVEQSLPGIVANHRRSLHTALNSGTFRSSISVRY